MRRTTTSNALRLLATWLALAIAASVTALAVGAGPAGAIAPACHAKVQGNSIAPDGGSSCYYVVVRQSDWKKVCEGYDRSFSCSNLRAGEYQVESYSTDPWKRVAMGVLVIEDQSGPGGGCDELYVNSGDILGGHVDGSCYYVVTDTSTWSRKCAGTLLNRGCAGRFDDLAPGKYKVDVYTTSPWTKLDSHFLTVA